MQAYFLNNTSIGDISLQRGHRWSQWAELNRRPTEYEIDN